MRGIMVWLAGAALLSGSCPAATQAHADDGKRIELWVKAAVTISPEGGITALRWDGTPKPVVASVQAGIEPKVRGLSFEPGRIDGVAAETETTLSLKLVLLERPDRSMGIRIAEASTGAAALEMAPPSYPASQLMSGGEAEVVSEIEIGRDGGVTLLDASYRGNSKRQSSRKEFLDSSIEAIRGWKYRVERVGGHPVAARMSIPIQFCLSPSKRPWCDGSEGATRSANGRQGPAGEAVALDSVARLKTDLATLDI